MPATVAKPCCKCCPQPYCCAHVNYGTGTHLGWPLRFRMTATGWATSADPLDPESALYVCLGANPPSWVMEYDAGEGGWVGTVDLSACAEAAPDDWPGPGAPPIPGPWDQSFDVLMECSAALYDSYTTGTAHLSDSGVRTYWRDGTSWVPMPFSGGFGDPIDPAEFHAGDSFDGLGNYQPWGCDDDCADPFAGTFTFLFAGNPSCGAVPAGTQCVGKFFARDYVHSVFGYAVESLRTLVGVITEL